MLKWFYFLNYWFLFFLPLCLLPLSLFSGFQAEQFAAWINSRAGTSVKVKRPFDFIGAAIYLLGVASACFSAYMIYTKAGKILGSRYLWSAVSLVRHLAGSNLLSRSVCPGGGLALLTPHISLFLWPQIVHYFRHDLWTYVESNPSSSLFCPYP